MRFGPSLVLLACFGLAVARSGWAQDCEGVEPVAGEAITLALVHPLLNRPVAVLAAPGDPDRLFIVEQRGLVRILDLRTNALRSAPFLSLTSRVSQTGNEQGLLGLAFHPLWRENGSFFVNYTRATDGATVVAKFQIDPADPNRALPLTEISVIEVPQPFSNNNGGHIAFGPLDHRLYIGLGDGGDANDPQNRAQDPQSLLGKMLRLDVDGVTEEEPYAIPPDNPFLADPGVRPEIWGLGLRNPWSYAFDSETGDLYLADVGEQSREEIDYVAANGSAGWNFEWKRREGKRLANASIALGAGVPVEPILEYPHSAGAGITGCAVIGGVVYRGCRLPDLRGTYFFADFCSERVYSFRVADGRVANLRERTRELNFSIPNTKIRSVSAFGTDARGEIYICDLTGKLYRIVPREGNIPPSAVIRTTPSSGRVLLAGESAEILLDASASDDGDGGTQELTVHWEKVSGPEGDTILDPDAPSTTVVFTGDGQFVYRATVDDGIDSDAKEITVLVIGAELVPFRRSDSNGDGNTDLSDGINTLRYLFVGDTISCPDAADADDSGDIDLSDAIFTFNYLFLGGGTPPAPGPDSCGADPTADLLPPCTPSEVCE